MNYLDENDYKDEKEDDDKWGWDTLLLLSLYLVAIFSWLFVIYIADILEYIFG